MFPTSTSPLLVVVGSMHIFFLCVYIQAFKNITSLNTSHKSNSEWLRNVTKVIEPVSRIRIWM